ncbi:MAG: hypothetical protein AB7K52_07410 [Phycisphaerales bacterium]
MILAATAVLAAGVVISSVLTVGKSCIDAPRAASTRAVEADRGVAEHGGLEHDARDVLVESAMRAQTQAGPGLIMIAERLATSDPELALEMLESGMRHSSHARDRATSAKMMADILLKVGRRAEAEDAFVLAIAEFDASPELVVSRLDMYASCVNLYAMLLWREGRTAEALDINERLLRLNELANALTDRSVVPAAMAHQAQMLQQSNDQAGAAAMIDALFDRFPGYGLADGSAIALRLWRSQLRVPNESASLARRHVELAWRDPSLRTRPEVVSAGLRLAEALHAERDPGRAAATLQEVAELIDHSMVQWVVHAGDVGFAVRSNLEAARLSALSSLATADRSGRPDLALWAIRRLRELATTDLERQSCDALERAVHQRQSGER